MFKKALLLPLLLLALRTLSVAGNFVTTQGTQFDLSGSPFFFYGSVSYWFGMLSDSELDSAFKSISDAGFRVVRTWAFNDVPQVPSSGAYFQVLANGKATINTGPNGLQRLDKVVSTAGKYGIKLLLTLTNNWNPRHKIASTAVVRRWNDDPAACLPRGFLSNDYGGMDMYVAAFHPNGTHDVFYTDPTIIKAFKNYVTAVVTRYSNSTTIFGWELANDPRCSSTLPASSSCNSQTITSWVADLAGFVKQLDPSHLVAAGDGGFYCIGCPKLFAHISKAKRNNFFPVGPAFDGSFGVDTEDITSIPSIDFGTFQLFPDQVQYYLSLPSNDTIAKIGEGNAWTDQHSSTAQVLTKPQVLTGYQIVTRAQWPTFVPFNASCPVPGGPPGGPGFTVEQHAFSVASFVTAAYNSFISGVLEFGTIPPSVQISKREISKRQITNYPDTSELGAALLQSKMMNGLPVAP